MVWMYAPFAVGVFLIVIGISFAVYMFDGEARNNSQLEPFHLKNMYLV